MKNLLPKNSLLYCAVVYICCNVVDGLNYTCPTRESVITMEDVQDSAKASEYIYKIDFKQGDQIPGTSFKVIRQFHEKFKNDGKGIKVILAEKGNTTIVAYRGTKGIEQLLTQVKSRIFDKKYELKINGTTVRILDFFHDAFQLTFKKVKPYLTDPTKKYILTGHSLGGALSSILALKMTQENKGNVWQNPNSCLITFGMPRVGKKDWANLHDKLIPTFRKLRFVYKSDPVTGIPQRLSGWGHHSRAVYIGSTKTIKLGRKRRFIDSKPFWKVCHDQEDYSCTNDITVLPSPTHHSMTQYYNAIMDPPQKYRTKAGSLLTNFEEMLLVACKQTQSYYVPSSEPSLSKSLNWIFIFFAFVSVLVI